MPLTYAEAREVDKVLSEIELPIVISDRSKSINVLFQNGLFLQDGVTNVADLYPEADCIVGDKAYILLRNEDFQHQFSRKINIGENWLLYCL